MYLSLLPWPGISVVITSINLLSLVHLLSIVILNYNGQQHLATFLPSVLAHAGSAEVIVADNGSNDGSVALLEKDFPSVRIIKLQQNYGFAGGYQEALKHVQAKYYLILNSDVELTPRCLEPLLNLMEANPGAAACQPKILDHSRPTHFEYAGPAGGFIDYLGYPFCRGRIFQTIEEDLGQYNDTTDVFWACGACMMVRADLYHEYGGFDDAFFAHMEEIDLCWRFKNAGYRILACGNSVVYHLGGGTLQYHNPKKTFLNFRNGLAMLYKNHPEKDLYLNVFKRLVLDGMAGIKFFIADSPADCWAIVRAHFNFYKHFSHWHGKRKALLRSRKLVSHSEILPESIVKKHFLQGKKTYRDIY